MIFFSLKRGDKEWKMVLKAFWIALRRLKIRGPLGTKYSENILILLQEEENEAN